MSTAQIKSEQETKPVYQQMVLKLNGDGTDDTSVEMAFFSCKSGGIIQKGRDISEPI